MAHSNHRRRPQPGRTYRGPTLKERAWQYTPLSIRRAIYQKQAQKRHDLRQYEDRREFHPQGKQRPARSFNSFHHRLRVAGIPIVEVARPAGYQQNFITDNFEALPYKVGFVQPKRVLICVRRKIRREVMHALKFAGGTGQKKPKYNHYSSVSC